MQGLASLRIQPKTSLSNMSHRDRLRRDALSIFQSGVAAVSSDAAVRSHVRLEKNSLQIGEKTYNIADRKIFVIAFGKAAAAMTFALESILGDQLSGGVAVTKYGHAAGFKLKKAACHEAAHPVPDEKSVAASQAIYEFASKLGKDDLVIVAISGGGSALLTLPVEGVSLADKQATTHALLGCGAEIQEINTVRTQLSRVKGGRLAQAIHPAELCTLVLSDVIGDPLDFIASGPTVPATTNAAAALRICERYEILENLPRNVRTFLQNSANDPAAKVPQSVFKNNQVVVVGNLLQALEAAAKKAHELGYDTQILTTSLQGEAREIAQIYPAFAADILKNNLPIKPPSCILTGGETTVTLRGNGKGGRNQELALAAINKLAGQACSVLLSAGTDGSDGPTDATGAIIDDQSLERAREAGLDVEQYLAQNNAYPFFEALGDLIITGQTHTNVMDMQILLVERR